MAVKDLLLLILGCYLPGSIFCRQSLQRGDVCVCVCNVKKDQCSNKTDISHHCREEDLEICAVEQETKTCSIIILSLYRAPS
jgi:hypothetical protein